MNVNDTDNINDVASLTSRPLRLHEGLPHQDPRVDDASLEPLSAGLVACVGGSNVLAWDIGCPNV